MTTAPGFACLDCGTLNPAQTGVTGQARPSPGDISICWTCGHLMAFADADGRVRALTEAEVVGVAGDPRIVRVNNARAQVRELSAGSRR
jgi:hypothetical protein